MSTSYTDFISDKAIRTPETGFLVEDAQLHPSNFPHQRDTIKWAAQVGRCGVFSSFGLGKTQVQLELARLCYERDDARSGRRTLIICPLGVKQEFAKDAKRLGMDLQYVRTQAEVMAATTPYLITNYERVRDGDIDPNSFEFVSLDEASVLRSYGSKTYQTFLDKFSEVPFRYVCTATPSPNRYKELIHYAGFLGVMDTGQALTRFFQRNSEKAGDLTLYPHKEEEFWLWVSSWAIFLQKPSDLGYSDEGYDLPELQVHWHRIELRTDQVVADKRDGQVKAFRDAAVSLSSAAKEKRESVDLRIAKAREIVDSEPGAGGWLLWHHLERERAAIEKEFPDSVSVYGTQDLEVKEERLIGFGNGDFPMLATKPEIAGQGCNFQRHCHRNIFLGINYQFNDFIQAIHRTHRFQQQHAVQVHILYTDSEDNIKAELEAKWQRHNELMEKMRGIIQQYGLSHADRFGDMRRSMDVTRRVWAGERAVLVNNDTVIETSTMESDSVDLIVTSIPFANHYEYTPSYLDFGHTDNNGHFWGQMDFLTPQLLRVLRPGRVYACHVKDRILFGNVTGAGAPTVSPFHAEALFHALKHGFDYMGMITVTTDVVRENNQTYRLGWSEQCKDGSKMGVGSPEYILLFRKPQSDRSKGYADVPVRKSKADYTRAQWQIDAHAYWRSGGNRFLTPEECKALPMETVKRCWEQFSATQDYNYDEHVRLGKQLEASNRLPATFMLFNPQAPAADNPTVEHSEVWTDVIRMRTLNMDQQRNRQEAHVCPLQFDIVERLINRYSNADELVYDPFMGIGTVAVCAIAEGRRARGSELNPMYFDHSIAYAKCAEAKLKPVPTLFDTIDEEQAA